MMPDTLATAPVLQGHALKWGKGCGRYVAWGVFEGPEQHDRLRRADEESLSAHGRDRREPQRLRRAGKHSITEYMGHSWYKGSDTYTSPYFVTEPEFTELRRGRPLHAGCKCSRLRRQALRGRRAMARIFGCVPARRVRSSWIKV